MSKSIDERVVEMRFDNKEFENNAQKSLSTLDRLKQSLNLLPTAEAMKGLGDVDASGINKFGNSVDTVKEKFSALEAIAVGALFRIGEKAADAGTQLVKSLTIDQVTAGWDKYAEKTSAVQTIMSATRESWEKDAKALGVEGDQMEYVTSQIDKLNWFTDETSYNFLDMVNNIGKFTNNGVALSEAVTSMEGISTWAALSGANVTEAGRAMYNLSQAMGLGAVTLQDWKSIENANMATMEFKNVAMETAAGMGNLIKVGDGLYQTLSGDEVTAENFRSTLTDSKWLDNNVLVATLNQFGGFSDVLNDAQMSMEGYYDTTSQLLKDIDAYANGDLGPEQIAKIAKDTGLSADQVRKQFDLLSDSQYDLGRRAFQAAQEAKTFKEAIDSVKDATSTSWMNIFQSIFGNYEEAKELWTAVANELYDAFVGPLDALEDLMSDWNELGGNAFLLEGIANIWGSIRDAINLVGEAFSEVFPAMDADTLVRITRAFRDFTAQLKLSEPVATAIKNVFKVFFTIVKGGLDALGFVAKMIWDFAAGVIQTVKSSEQLQRLFTNLNRAFDKMWEILGKIREALIAAFGKFKETESFKIITERINNLKTALENLAGGVLERINNALETFVGTEFSFDFSEAVNWLDQVLLNLIYTLDSLPDKFRAFKQSAQDAFSTFADEHGLTEKITTVRETIEGILNSIVNIFSGNSENGESLFEKAKDFLASVGKGFKEGLALIDWDAILNVAKVGSIAYIVYNVVKIFRNLAHATDALAEIPEKVVKILDNVSGVLKGYQNKLNAQALNEVASAVLKIAAAIGVFALATIALSFLDTTTLSTVVVSIGLLSLALMGILAALTKFKDSGADKNVKLFSNAVSKMAGALKRFATLFGIAAIITSVALSIGILAIAVKALAKMPVLEALKSVTILAGLAAILLTAVKYLSTLEKTVSMKSVATIMALALALNMLIVPLKLLGGKGDWHAVGQVAVTIAALVGAVALLSKFSPDTLKGAGSIVVLALAIDLLTPAIISLGKHWEEAWHGLLAIGIAMGTLLLGSWVANLGPVAAGMKNLESVMTTFGNTALKVGITVVAIGGGMYLAAKAIEVLAAALQPLAQGFVDFFATLNENRDVFVEWASNIINDIGVVLENAIPQLAALVIKVIVALIEAIEVSSGEIIAGVLKLIIVFLDYIEEAFIPLTNKLVSLIAKLMADLGLAILDGYMQLKLACGILIESLGLVLADGFAEILAGLVEGIPVIGERGANAIRQSAETMMEEGRKSLEESRTKLEAMSEEVADAIPRPVVRRRGAVSEAAQQAAGGLSEGFAKGASGASSSASSAAEDAINSMISKIQGGGTNIFNAGNGLGTNFLDGINSTLPDIANIGVDLTSMFSQTIADQQGTLAPSVETFLSGADTPMEVAVFDWETDGLGHTKAYEDAIINETPNVSDTIQEMLDASELPIDEATLDWEQFGFDHTDAYSQAVRDNIDTVKSAAYDTAMEGEKSVEETVPQFESAGNMIPEGVARGIRNNQSAAINAAGEMARASLQAAKMELQIQSPSRAFEEVGMYSDQGFAQGLLGYVSVIENASGKTAQTALDKMRETLSESGNLIDDLMMDPVIRPVLDLSGVEDGVSTVNSMFGDSRLRTNGISIGSAITPQGRLLDSIAALRSDQNNPYSGIQINVYAAQGQSEEQTAQLVMNKLNIELQRRKAAMG